jgi:hypothetical protein
MTIQTKKIGFTIDIDTKEIAPASVNVWIYQLLNRLGYEHTITSITVDDVTVPIANKQEMYDLPIGEDKDLQANKKTL